MKNSETAGIYQQHEENLEALKKLEFYKGEVGIITKWLDELASKNTSKNVLVLVERYENQMKIQRNNIDMIRHEIAENEKSLQQEVLSNPVAVDHRKVAYHTKEKELIDGFELNFNLLRTEIKEFVGKWL
jgi:hypothetical protein